MGFLPEPYGRMARRLEEKFLRLIGERDPSLPPDRRGRLASALAAACVLSSMYLAGDALAGWLLQRLGNDPATAKRIIEVLGRLGARGLPEPRLSVSHTCLEIMREAVLGYEELDNMLRDLYKTAMSGGRHIPSWARENTGGMTGDPLADPSGVKSAAFAEPPTYRMTGHLVLESPRHPSPLARHRITGHLGPEGSGDPSPLQHPVLEPGSFLEDHAHLNTDRMQCSNQ